MKWASERKEHGKRISGHATKKNKRGWRNRFRSDPPLPFLPTSFNQWGEAPVHMAFGPISAIPVKQRTRLRGGCISCTCMNLLCTSSTVEGICSGAYAVRFFPQRGIEFSLTASIFDDFSMYFESRKCSKRPYNIGRVKKSCQHNSATETSSSFSKIIVYSRVTQYAYTEIEKTL